MKTLAELQSACVALGIEVEAEGRASKEPYIAALRDYRWQSDYPGEPLPEQVMPMLLGSWEVLDEEKARELEEDCHGWLVQEKHDGVRAILRVEDGRVRITSRTISDVTYRLSELEQNLEHLTTGLLKLDGSVLDGELLCPVADLDTGSTLAATSLQATMAILATSPDNARRIQASQDAHVRFHAFDVLRYCGQDVTARRLIDRLDILEKVLRQSDNPFIETVPSFVVNKQAIHDHIVASGGEGTVWKRVDQPYLPGRRVGHWIKRKRGIEVEAFVSGFKPGNNGHTSMVGAVEFSIRQEDGSSVPIAWVSSWTEEERRAMTHANPTGKVVLNPVYMGRRALIEGQDHSAKSRRMRHARMRRWLVG